MERKPGSTISDCSHCKRRQWHSFSYCDRAVLFACRKVAIRDGRSFGSGTSVSATIFSIADIVELQLGLSQFRAAPAIRPPALSPDTANQAAVRMHQASVAVIPRIVCGTSDTDVEFAGLGECA